MKVLELQTKKIIEVNASYGLRLIEHGMAVLPPSIAKAEEKRPKKGDG